MRLRQAVCVCAATGVAALAVFAQSAPGKMEFEVASVKPAVLPTDGIVMRRMGAPDPGLVNFTNVTLKMLVAAAYDVKEYQVSGPDWMNDDGFDIQAKTPAGATKEQIPLMLQALLADRFKLTFHREKKNLSVYALVVGKNGPKLKEVDAETLKAQAEKGAPAAPPQPPPPGPDGVPNLAKMPPGPGLMMMMTNTGAREMRGQATMPKLANALSKLTDRPVLDMTGFTGTYNVDMVWAADERENNQLGRMIVNGGGGQQHAEAANAGDSAPTPGATIYKAVENSLGLRLDPRKTDAEFLVIDSAEKVPTEN